MALTYEQIEKQTRFINKDEAGRGTGTENGGIPIGSNDLVQIQENARADNVALLEFFREHTKEANGNIGSSLEINGVDYERGLILQGGRYLKIDGGSFDIEPGKMYLHGEVIDFPGQNLAFSLGNVFWIWREKTDFSTSTRVFKDGNSKEVLTIPTYSTGFSDSKDEKPAAMSETSQHIRYEYSNVFGAGTVCENYTLFKATGLTNLKEQTGQGPLISLTPSIAGSGTITGQTFHNKRNATVKVDYTVDANEIDANFWRGLFNISALGITSNRTKYFTGYVKQGGSGEKEEVIPIRLLSSGIFDVKYTLADLEGGTLLFSFDLTIENDAWSGSETKQTERWMRHPDDNTESL